MRQGQASRSGVRVTAHMLRNGARLGPGGARSILEENVKGLIDMPSKMFQGGQKTGFRKGFGKVSAGFGKTSPVRPGHSGSSCGLAPSEEHWP